MKKRAMRHASAAAEVEDVSALRQPSTIRIEIGLLAGEASRRTFAHSGTTLS